MGLFWKSPCLPVGRVSTVGGHIGFSEQSPRLPMGAGKRVRTNFVFLFFLAISLLTGGTGQRCMHMCRDFLGFSTFSFFFQFISSFFPVFFQFFFGLIFVLFLSLYVNRVAVCIFSLPAANSAVLDRQSWVSFLQFSFSTPRKCCFFG